MNGLDDDDIRRRLNSLFDDEPPMASVAVDDLSRGRQLVRRRRRTAMVATATALPAVLVGGWAVSTAAFGSSGPATLQPADGAGPTDASDDATVTVCWIAAATPVPGDGGAIAADKPPSPTLSAPGEDDPATAEPTPADPARCEAVPWVADDCSASSFELTVPDDTATSGTDSSSSGSASSGSSDSSAGTSGNAGGNAVPDVSVNADATTLHPGYTLLVPPTGANDGTPGAVGFACDGIGTVLQQYADPTGKHAGTMASGSGEATTGDGPQSSSASLGWTDGDREGQVTLSLSKTPGSSDCDDPSLESGPAVTCESRTLANGTVVQVGHGSADGADRVSVRFDRADGMTVWATADEATDAWWGGDHRTDALAAPPMSVDDMITMVTDKAIQ